MSMGQCQCLYPKFALICMYLNEQKAVEDCFNSWFILSLLILRTTPDTKSNIKKQPLQVFYKGRWF